MSEEPWDVFLHSKIRGREYESIAGAIPVADNWICRNDNFLRVVARCIERTTPDSPVSYLLAENGDDVILGACGSVAAVLGEDHPQAWDRREGATRGGRVKPFFLGYTAPKGTPVPSAADLEGLTSTLKTDLERLFEEAERICPVWTESKHFVTNLASSPAMSDSAWDHAVRKLNSEHALDGVVTFCDGKSELVPFPRLAVETPPKEGVKVVEEIEATEQPAKRWLSRMMDEPWMGKKGLLFGVGAVALGTAAYGGWRALHKDASGNHEASR